MYIDKLQLVNFRSHVKSGFEFGKRTLIFGVNGAGKSNILEAVYMVATGKSFRAESESELLGFGQSVSNISCEIECQQESMVVSVVLSDGSLGYGRKKFTVNGISRRQMDVVGKLRAVLFSPADIELVTGSPSSRRRYLDFVIGQIDKEYRRSLLAYEKALRQRNKLLDLIKEGVADRNQLFFWDRVLIKNGQYITDKRAEFLEIVGFLYDKSTISEQRLSQYRVEEVAAGSTLVGPHRDDFVFTIKIAGTKNHDPLDVAKYGSRGEQRMALWWLKQCEIVYLASKGNAGQENEMPVLLLDDIFSELDVDHRQEVVKYVGKYSGQVIMTTAEEEARNIFDFDKVIEL